MLNIEHSLRILSREWHQQKVHSESHVQVEVSSPGGRGLVQRASEFSWGHWRTEQCWDTRELEGGESLASVQRFWFGWEAAGRECDFSCFPHLITLRFFSFLVTFPECILGSSISYVRLLQMQFDQWREEPPHTFMNAAHRSWGSSWTSLHSDDSHGLQYCLQLLKSFFSTWALDHFLNGIVDIFTNE